MSNNTTNVSVPIKGMDTDLHPQNLSEQGYDFALNAVVEEFDGNGFPLLQNESSTLRCVNYPEGFKLVGYVNVIEQNRKILFLVNPDTNESEIGEIKGVNADCDKLLEDTDDTNCSECGPYIPKTNSLENMTIPNCCIYKTVVNQDCLNFSIDNPVRSTYRLQDCEIEVFFTDNRNPYRHITFEYIDDLVSNDLVVKNDFLKTTGFDPENCNVPIYSNELDCNKILLDPVVDIPCVELIDVLQGGELKAGVYQFLFAYAEEDGLKRSSYFPATNQIPLFTRAITFDTDYRTDRSIAIRVTGIDETISPYEFFNIAVAKTINGITSFEFLGTYPITQKTIIYSGAEKSLIDLDSGEIFAQKTFYGSANYIAKSNSFLFFGDLEETKKLNIQRITNNVKLQWQTVAIPEAVYRNPRFVNKFRTYLRDEVYPFGLVLIYDNNEESVVGHIPGPSKAYFQSQYGLDVDQIIANNDVIEDPTCFDNPRNKLWQTYNTAQLVYTNPSVPITDTCDDNKCYQYGDFAYHESTELYPNDPEIWGELCGTPIRHHRFPDSSVTHIHDGLNASRQFSDGNIVFPIGVKIDHQSVLDAIQQAIVDNIITMEDALRIKGYRLVRGNRFGNKSIIAKGLIYDVWNYVKNDITYYYPNYPYNDLRPDKFLTEDKNTYDDHDSKKGANLPFRKTGRYTFHSPDTHFVQPVIGTEVKLETLEYGKSEGYFNYAEDQSKQKLLSTTSYLIALASGLLGAFLDTVEVRESSYTIKGIDVSALGVAAGTYGPTIVAPINVNPLTGPFNNDTGLPNFSTLAPPTSTIVKNTKQGTKEQMLGITAPAIGAIIGGVFGGIVGAFSAIQSVFYRFGLVLSQTEIFADLIRTFTPLENYSIQYNSVGRYNSYKIVPNAGNKRRSIETYSYLKPEMASIDENVSSVSTGLSSIIFNNWHRESSVYIKTPDTNLLPNPSIIDDSRFPIECRGGSGCDFKNFDRRRFYKNISSYYASIKQYSPDQYGRIANIEYIDVGNCSFLLDNDYADCNLVLFGGDTFISRFALKRKHSYFLQTRFSQADEIDVNYSDLHNVAYPYYYFNTVTGVGTELSDGQGIANLITDPASLLGRPKSYLDSKTNKFFYQNGKMYLYSYGIPYFLVESDINVDYRYGENTREKDFFPNQQDLDFWLQEKNVSPAEDNYYFYNTTYSKQNKEHPYSQYGVKFEPGRMCKVSHPNRVIYSNGSQWLNFKPNDYYDFSQSNGRLIGVDGIENDKVLVRSENMTQVFNAYVTIPTSADSIQVGTGGMFQSKPQEYAKTDLGYAGSQHNAILHTEFGHIWVDAKRGNVFNLQGNNMDEISRNGKKNWFKENLPFQILKDFPAISEDTDNSFKNIGITLGFDKRFNRFLLTKLDYKLLDNTVTYDATNKVFKKGDDEVSLDDSRYFCNKSWTMSYNFYTKSWVSYHSYKPNYYIDNIETFMSGINKDSSLWLHNITNKSYQVFYGKLWPFTVQTISKSGIDKQTTNSLEFGLDAIRYHNDYDLFYANNVTFNKAVVFNAQQNSGLLELKRKNVNDLSEVFPVSNPTSTTIKITNADGVWRFNQFYDISYSRGNNIPLWLNDCANVDKMINPKGVNYQMPDLDKKRMRGEYVRVKLTNDEESRYKMIFKWLVNKSVKSYR